jgi:hypothetical protein
MAITSEGLEHLGFIPHKDYVLRNDGDGVYIDQWNSASPQPSVDDIEAAHAEWQAEQNATQYQRDRAPEYPPIGDQLDALLKHLNYRRTQGDELVQELDDVIAEWLSVKSRHPKP